MTQPPVFHLLAGPNGAGKSTLYRALVSDEIIGADLMFVNADLYERDHLQHITNPSSAQGQPETGLMHSEQPSLLVASASSARLSPNY